MSNEGDRKSMTWETWVCICFAIVALSGCATIIHGGSQKVGVRSQPPGVSVTARRGGKKVETPGFLLLSRKTAHKLNFEKEGYESKEVQVRVSVSGLWWWNVFLGPGAPVGMIVDGLSGAAYKLEPAAATVRLEKQPGGDAGTDQEPPGPVVIRPDTGIEPSVWRPSELSQVWVLCIGVERYGNDSVPTLPYARNDAESVRNWFTSDNGPNVPSENAHVLFDEQATRDNLMRQIDWLRRRAMPEDLVVVYFAGHGAPEVAPDGKSVDAKYLVLYDTNPDDLFATGLPLEDLTRRLDMVQAEVQLVILECCYAGPVGKEVLASIPTADLEIRPRQIEQMGGRTGRVILTASSGRQMALGSADLNSALFTHYLLEHLEDGTKRLVGDCFTNIWDDVRRHAALLGSRQEPEKFGDANVDVILRTD